MPRYFVSYHSVHLNNGKLSKEPRAGKFVLRYPVVVLTDLRPLSLPELKLLIHGNQKFPSYSVFPSFYPEPNSIASLGLIEVR